MVKHDDEYADFYIEGKNGEQYYQQIKKEFKVDPSKTIAKHIGLQKCDIKYPSGINKTANSVCHDGVNNAYIDDNPKKD